MAEESEIQKQLMKDHPELYNTKKEIKKVETSSEKIKSVSPIISQMVLRKLGMYCSERMNVDQYYLIEAVNILIAEVGEDFIRERYEKIGRDWDKVKKVLDDITVNVSRVKTFYDPILDKKMSKSSTKGNTNKIEQMFLSHFTKWGRKLALVQRELYDIFVFIVDQTTIQRQQIKNEAFKILEHQGYRTLEDKSKKSSATSSGA